MLDEFLDASLVSCENKQAVYMTTWATGSMHTYMSNGTAAAGAEWGREKEKSFLAWSAQVTA